MINKNNQGMNSHKELAVAFLHLVAGGKIHEAFTTFVSPGMRHHNAAFAGDAASLEKAMEKNQLEFPHKKLNVKRVFEDGDLVAVHSNIILQEGKPGIATVHIFKFEGDRIIEMWDIGQAVPENSPNQNGMF